MLQLHAVVDVDIDVVTHRNANKYEMTKLNANTKKLKKKEQH